MKVIVPQDLFEMYRSLFFYACFLVAAILAVIIIENKSDEECGFVVVRSTGTLTEFTVFIFVVAFGRESNTYILRDHPFN